VFLDFLGQLEKLFFTSVVIFEHLHELPGQRQLLLVFLNLVANRAVSLEDEGNDDIEHYQGADDPESGEVQARPAGTYDCAVHVRRLVPVVDHQHVKQGDHARVQVVEVY